MQIYTWIDKRSEKRMCSLVMIAGCTLGLWCAYVGAASKFSQLIAVGVAFACLSTMVTILLLVRVDRMFVWCYSNTLEVKNGIVVKHHHDPFFYKPKGLEDTCLFSMPTAPILVVKTLRISGGGGVIRYQVECTVEICELQLFHDRFLVRTGDELDNRSPEMVIQEALEYLLALKREEIVDHCTAYREEELDVQTVNIRMVMQYKMERFLRENLVRYGLSPVSVRCTCSIDPYVIE